MMDKFSTTIVIETTDVVTALDITRATSAALQTLPSVTAVYAGDPVAVRSKETKLEKHVRLFNAGAIDKFEFFSATMNYSSKLVAELSEIDHGVVLDRRRYLRQLAEQGKCWEEPQKRIS
jgi:hypothetical protein